MRPSCGPSRSRVLSAVGVSLALHALLGVGWLTVEGHPTRHNGIIMTAVDGPDDHETVFVLCDPPKPRTAPTRPAEVDPRPTVLPPSVTHPADSGPGPAATVQTAYSQPKVDSLLNSEAPPVHGRLKPGESVVYVIDCSASMGLDGMLGSAVASLKASLARLGPDVRFQIVAYNGGTSTFGTELLPARAETISGAGRWLDKLVAEGRSDHRAGMREALWFRPDHVYLLTDADDLTEGDARAVRALIHTPVQMSAAIFGGLRTKWVSPLERLVGDFSGTVQYMRR